MQHNRTIWYFYSGAIGEALLGIHIARVVSANVPGASVRLVAPRENLFVQELTAELPFVTYGTFSKRSWRAWLSLPFLSFKRRTTIVLQPVTINLPWWWKLVLWSARRRKGSRELRYQMRGRERTTPPDVLSFVYDCQTENYFDTPPAMLGMLGIPITTVPRPTIPTLTESQSAPYIQFHFFAGNYKRTIPTEHAREILQRARVLYPTHEFVMTCGPGEEEKAKVMAMDIPNVRVQAALHVKAMLSLLSNAELVVGTASGILLLAAHLPKPVVALSCLSDPCWLPTFSPLVTILAARNECRCGAAKMGDCSVDTPGGKVFRCLYYIRTEEVLRAIQDRYKVSSNS